jgi:putative superfamily III holin-X
MSTPIPPPGSTVPGSTVPGGAVSGSTVSGSTVSGSMARPDVGDASVGELIGKVTRDLSTLMRQELALAQAEVKQEVRKTAKGAGALSGAGLAAFFVVLFLSLALWAGLSNVMNAGWAGLIVAAVWAIIGGVLFAVGRQKLREVNPKPERTVDTLSNVPDALKGNHRGGSA